MLHTMEAFLWILVEAAHGGVIQVIQGRYSEFTKGQALGLAVAAELSALRELVTFRNYSGYADAMIQRQEGYVPTILDVIAISVEEDYFTRFRALSSEISIFGELAGEVTSVYAHAKGVIEDLVSWNAVNGNY